MDEYGKTSRRNLLKGSGALAAGSLGLSLLPASIQRALAIPANSRTGTLRDVEHIVVLMQENRSFDHYFGSLSGVRGFGDRFPIPVPDSPQIQGKTVWYQTNVEEKPPRIVMPFHLNTQQTFPYMRVEGTPHTWPDAQYAWRQGMMNLWPTYKNNHSMGYFKATDIPFQYAMADAFTLCDAYHCSFQGGTTPNRIFLWCGTNDPLALGKGPVMGNLVTRTLDSYDPAGGFLFSSYAERLEKAGVSWCVYQDMKDNFGCNPLAAFQPYRASYFGKPGSSPVLKEKALSTRALDALRQDVLADRLPRISWIVGTAEGSEHPGPSSPAQGADYTAKALDALTANPDVWSKTVLLVNFDENDGFFDHMPPPAAPSYLNWDPDPEKAVLAGGSTVSTLGEYHINRSQESGMEREDLFHQPYGLGPRVPLYVISPWSRGGWVNSQVFDHTSVIRFMEERFGVMEPNITPWRRAVCGDLMSCFDFATPNAMVPAMPDTTDCAVRTRALPERTSPTIPALPELPYQEAGVRPSRALPYELHTSVQVETAKGQVELIFANSGAAAAVFHVYDRHHLDLTPRRYTVESGKQLSGLWPTSSDAGLYDLWVLGPNGFHRHFTGDVSPQGRGRQVSPEIQVCYDRETGGIVLKVRNDGSDSCPFEVRANAYFPMEPQSFSVSSQRVKEVRLDLKESRGWYDFSVSSSLLPGYSRRFAGRVETGAHSVSDPAMGGQAWGDQWRVE